MRRFLTFLVAAILLAAYQLGVPSVARADDGVAGATVWAAYAPIGDTAIEVRNVGDHANFVSVTVYYPKSAASDAQSLGWCSFFCAQTFKGPELQPGESASIDLGDRACSTGLSPYVCFPDGAITGLRIDAVLETGTGANAGATSRDPSGRIAAAITVPSGTYDATVTSHEVVLTHVARRLEDADGLTSALRLVGAGPATVRWYLDKDLAILLAEQRVTIGASCCGEFPSWRPGASTVDPRDVEELADDVEYTVLITSASEFAATWTDATDDR